MSNVEIPAQEVELDTKRQRLFHVTWLNRERLNKQLRPLLAELENGASDGGRMGILAKATFRGAVTLVNHYLHFDIREHPSAIFLMLLKLIDDRSFDAVWDDYKPLVSWVNDNGNEEGTYTSSEAPSINSGPTGTLQLSPSPGLSNVNGRNEGEWKDYIQQDLIGTSGRQETDSDTGQQT